MKEKKTGKDSGRLLHADRRLEDGKSAGDKSVGRRHANGRHAVRVSKFLQVAVLAAGVLGMSAASQSMTEISEKEQPLWQVWSAEECDAGLTVETVGENLILQKKAKLTADSEEGRDFRAMYAGDGNHTDETLRWSSENDWENNDHWLMADFGESVSIGAVRIYWERTNAKGYALEYSQDKEHWQQASVFEEAPEQKEQQIVLNEPVEARYFRLHVTDVLKEESDLSLYYQNVSVQELEVYGQLEDCFVVETPVIEAGSRRTLELPTVPEPYSISFGGADYDVLVNMDGKITDTIADTQVELGFILEKDGEELAEAVTEVDGDAVNVRVEPSEEAEVAGKLYKNCGGTILEQADGWTKLTSGELTGWTKDEFLLFGDEAEAMQQEVGSLKATVKTDALRVRKEASEDAGIYTVLALGESVTAVEEADGWVTVQVDEDTQGYVRADYVDVAFTVETGKTTEQIEAEKKEEEKKKLSENRGAVSCETSDVTLLAALIQCEAGRESYEGKLAVGAVVMNRVRSGSYPGSISGVINAPSQFPPATNGKVAAVIANGPSASCVEAAQAAIDGATNVGGATHFRAASSGQAGVVIGNHVFW